jgi:hypothetical protein
VPEPARPAPLARPKATAKRPGWARLAVSGVAALVALIAAAIAPWETVDTSYAPRSFGLLEEGGGIPKGLGALALAGVLICIALALVVQLIRTAPVFRAVATTAILLTAFVALVGASVVANDETDSMSWGPVVLAAALAMLAVVTGVPALNAARRPAA